MPSEPVTPTPAGETPVVAPSASGTNAAVPSQEQPILSSREMLESGVDLNSVEWLSKYNGVVGANRQLQDSQKTLKGRVSELEAANAKLAEQTQAAQVLQGQVTTLQAEAETHKAQLERTKLLLRYPKLLTLPGVDELVANSTLAPDALKTHLDAILAALPETGPVQQPQQPPGSTPPPPVPAGGPVPANGTPGTQDAEYWHEEALKHHDAFINGGRIDTTEMAKEQEAWAKYRSLKT